MLLRNLPYFAEPGTRNSILCSILLRKKRILSISRTIPYNEVEDTTAAVFMVDKYGGKDTPGNMAVNTRLPTHAL